MSLYISRSSSECHSSSECSSSPSGSSSLFSQLSDEDSSPSSSPSRSSTSMPECQANESFQPQSIRLPLKLPGPPQEIEHVDFRKLVLDDDLVDVPAGFYAAKLRSMGADLLKMATSSRLHVCDGPNLPSYLACSAPTPKAGTGEVLPPPPTHVLSIRALDSSRNLIVPVHGLLWASKSTVLSSLSCKAHLHPAFPHHPHLPKILPPSISTGANASSDFFNSPSFLCLPVIKLNLCSSAAFPLLQSWIYLCSPGRLLASLLPSPPTSHTKSHHSLFSILNPTPSSVAQVLSHHSSQLIMDHLNLVHGLWQDVVALQIADEELWSTMSKAWAILVHCLVIKESRN